MEEAGYKGFIVEPGNGVMAPQGTPPAVVVKLNAAFKRSESARAKRLEDADCGSGERPSARRTDPQRVRRWAKVVKANKHQGRVGRCPEFFHAFAEALKNYYGDEAVTSSRHWAKCASIAPDASPRKS
jgi:hypothetical protein